MTVSPIRELLFAFFSFLFGCGTACADLFLSLFGKGEASGAFRVSLPYPPLRRHGEKRLKKQAKAKRWARMAARFLRDTFFWLFVGAAYCVLVYAAHDGVVRWYALLLVASGFFCVYKLLHPVVFWLHEKLLNPLFEWIRFCLLWALFPLSLSLHGICRGSFWLVGKIRAPFLFLCGILRTRAGKKRQEKLRQHSLFAGESEHGARRPLTSTTVFSTKRVGPRKEMNESGNRK